MPSACWGRRKRRSTRDFFAERLKRALAVREAFFAEPYYRLVHAEGDRLPGIIVDRFGDTVVVQITTAGMERFTDEFLAALDEVIAPACVILRNDTPARALEALELLCARRQGRSARADDRRRKRRALSSPIRKPARNPAGITTSATTAPSSPSSRKASACSMPIATPAASPCSPPQGAAQGRRARFLGAGAQARRSRGAGNGVGAVCTFRKADISEELERLAQTGERFDIVIADPPPFVPSRKDIEAGARAYRKLARLAATLVAPGGILMLASCSHNMAAERFALECAAGLERAGRTARLIRQSGAGPDHPVHPMLPESAYLKALAYAVD